MTTLRIAFYATGVLCGVQLWSAVHGVHATILPFISIVVMMTWASIALETCRENIALRKFADDAMQYIVDTTDAASSNDITGPAGATAPTGSMSAGSGNDEVV